jgi:SAM-dependent methyltransferase
MGISGLAARVMATEHKYRPFPKEVHLLGRQTIHLSLGDLNRIFAEVGLPPQEVSASPDTRTREAVAKALAGQALPLSDDSFFEAYGVERIRAVDHSDYEGADIVFDLTQDMPKRYENSADLIYDGSVMDNVFNPAAAMQNVARMLKPGGRYIGQNLATTKWLPAYVAFNPYWFFDFFVVNGFRDVRVYVADLPAFRPGEPWPDADIYLLDPNADHREVHQFPISNGVSNVTILAEKDDDSTGHKQTSQAQYRLPEEWEEFDSKLARIRESDRSIPAMSRKMDRNDPPGFIYVGTVDFLGLNSEGPGENPAIEPRGEIDFSSSFDGSGWSGCESHAGTGWRWIDDGVEQSTVILNLATGRDHVVEATVHTARDSAALYSLRARIDGEEAAEQKIDYTAASPKLIFKIPARDTNRVRLGFKVGVQGRKPGDLRSVALSRIVFYPDGDGLAQVS